MNRFRIKSALALFALLITGGAHADDFGDSWISVNSKSIQLSERFSTKSHAEIRFPDTEEIGYVRLSQKLYTQLSDNWQLGTHPTFENSKSRDSWNETYRLDLELNPAKFTVGDQGPSVSFRNRWELRWKEGRGSKVFHRLRQYTKATWNIDVGPFNSFTIGNEVFFEEDKGKITMNRFYPVALGSKIKNTKASYFLLYQSKRAGTASDWNGAYILGASFSL